jgi:putative two-component system response regulator
MVEMKDAYTQGHVERVSNLAVAVGRKLNLADTDIEALRLGGALHDIGKVVVPSTILNKKESLTPEEWQVLKTHPEVGYRICLPLKKNLGAALDIIRHHHERLDGSGYPDHLQGDDIPVVTQIMTAVDVYDALTTNRLYRRALEKEEAFKVMRKQGLEKKLNEEIVHHLIGVVQNR